LVSARQQVEHDVRQTLVDGLGLSASEVDHALGAMQSRLDVRISQLFQSTARALPGLLAAQGES
jgi:hypothetical protein